MAMEAKKPLYGGNMSTPAAGSLPIRGVDLNNTPFTDLGRNRIAREAINPTGQAAVQEVTALIGTPAMNQAYKAAATAPKATAGGSGTAKVKPTNPYPAYTSRHQPNIDSLLEKLQNREAYQFNLTQNPLYRQMAAQTMVNGKRAMQDTMAQAAALTGGYGSSFASTAGNQAYQQQVNQLNDSAIDLYALERQGYDQEGADMRSTLSALQTAENMDRSNFESDRNDYYDYLSVAGHLNPEQLKAWQQYQYWNNLWQSKQK